MNQLIQRIIQLTKLKLEDDFVINVAFVNDRKMTQVNMDFLEHEGTTDVISFCYFEGDDDLFAGDVAVDLFICVDFAEREGASRKKSNYARELTLYIVHGLLHAAGEDDLDIVSRKRMRRREREVMAELEKEFKLELIFKL